jgi:hypothetical protein
MSALGAASGTRNAFPERQQRLQRPAQVLVPPEQGWRNMASLPSISEVDLC